MFPRDSFFEGIVLQAALCAEWRERGAILKRVLFTVAE